MFWNKKLSKTAKNTIVKNYGRLKGGGRRKPPLPKYATDVNDCVTFAVEYPGNC